MTNKSGFKYLLISLIVIFPITISAIYFFAKKIKGSNKNVSSEGKEKEISTRGIRNNNPLNIRYSVKNAWRGKIDGEAKKDKDFEEFDNLEYGIRAGCVLLMNYMKLHGLVTIETILKRFAPAVENPTSNYILYVERGTGFNRNQILTPDIKIIAKLVKSMALFESGINLTETKIVEAYEKD